MELVTATFPESAPANDREMSIAGSERLNPKEAELSMPPRTPIKITGFRPILSERDDQK